jgi:ABC-type multidrug transport system ATPase subunit
LKKHVLEVDGILKKYNDKVVLSDIYLKCETGQIVGLLGRNGSGKSTLLKIISGLVPAPDKCIRIDSVSKNNQNFLLKEVSYLSQNQFIPNYLSVQKTIRLAVDKQNRCVFYSDTFIQSILNKKVRHLSGGELRYLEVKLLIFNASKFILLDEPYTGLSPIMIETINKMIKENLNRKGFIITDHNYHQIMDVSSHLVLLKEGNLLFIKDKVGVFEKEYLGSSAFF